jgi:hypothetical protein
MNECRRAEFHSSCSRKEAGDTTWSERKQELNEGVLRKRSVQPLIDKSTTARTSPTEIAIPRCPLDDHVRAVTRGALCSRIRPSGICDNEAPKPGEKEPKPTATASAPTPRTACIRALIAGEGSQCSGGIDTTTIHCRRLGTLCGNGIYGASRRRRSSSSSTVCFGDGSGSCDGVGGCGCGRCLRGRGNVNGSGSSECVSRRRCLCDGLGFGGYDLTTRR